MKSIYSNIPSYFLKLSHIKRMLQQVLLILFVLSICISSFSILNAQESRKYGEVVSGVPTFNGCTPKLGSICKIITTIGDENNIGVSYKLISSDGTSSSPYINFEITRVMKEKTSSFTVNEDLMLDLAFSESLDLNYAIVLLKGEYQINTNGTLYGSFNIPIRYEIFSKPIRCDIVQDGSFSNVTTYISSSNISNTSNPWKPGANSPQWGGNDGCDGAGGFAQMWGNKVVGESILQTLGGGGIISGQKYQISFCAKLMKFVYDTNPVKNAVRFRVIAYNGAAPNRSTLPTANATLIYETPDITVQNWQNYLSCGWIADKNYTNIEILPVNSSSINDGDFVSWGKIDNVQLCQINPCDGLGAKIYPDTKITDKCCYKVDLSVQTCISNLKSIRLTAPAGITFTGASAPLGWTQTTQTSTQIVWDSPSLASGVYTGGSFCLNAPNANPFFVMIEWLDDKGNVICRSEQKMVCPPLCLDIQKLKYITCVGYGSDGLPQYSFCLDVVNNGVAQSFTLSSTSGVFTPSTFNLLNGINTICGMFSPTTLPPPTSFTLLIINKDRSCKDSIVIKSPDDCPPRECLNIGELKLNCLATNQLGNPTYTYSFTLTNVSGIFPNTVVISSNGGVETVLTNVPLNTATNPNGVIQYATSVKGQICIVITVRNAQNQVICRKTICAKAPECKDCCTDFDQNIKINSIKRTGINANGDNISMDLSFAPNRPIKSMAATIVSSSRRRLLPTASGWERIYGDIGGATAIPTPVGPGLRYYGGIAPSTSFEVPTLKTREVTWGTNYAGTTGAFNTTIGLLFPIPLSGSIVNPTVDELDYYLRISMTDVNCITCDTLLHIKLNRKSSPWNIENNNTTKGIKSVKDNNSGKLPNKLAADINVGSVISIKMTSNINGELMINLPNTNTSDEKITIVGVGIIGDNFVDIEDFSPVSNNFTKASADLGFYCEGTLNEGENAKFNITYVVPPFSKWDNTIQIKYRVGNSSEVLEDFVNVIASTPVTEVGGDLIAEISSEISKPRTYALSFTNANKSNRAIANVMLKMPENIKLLAIGSNLSDSVKLNAMAEIDNSGQTTSSYLQITENTYQVRQDLAVDQVIKPIFITVSGGEGALDINFTTYDFDGTILSDGSVSLLTPLSVNNEDGKEQSMLMEIYPNPATNQFNINLGLVEDEVMNITLTDINGKEMMQIVNQSKMHFGDNIISINTTNLNTGTYIITARSVSGKTITSKLQITK